MDNSQRFIFLLYLLSSEEQLEKNISTLVYFKPGTGFLSICFLSIMKSFTIKLLYFFVGKHNSF